ncbi:MAG: hypothetical protein EHM58_15470 [Ignavibacteriae bacterium]|nr:MAG: hypothetical protein EHM58_15470 [Ignavibacteriota bacterium]
MNISQKTKDIIFDIIEFSGNKLKNTNDVSLLLEASAKDDMSRQSFKDLIFTAKYLNGLGKIMMNSVVGNNNNKDNKENKAVIGNSADKIRDEYKKNIEHLTTRLNYFLSLVDENNKNAFTNRYLNMTRTAMVNLTSLIYDLSWVKKYFNEKGM